MECKSTSYGSSTQSVEISILKHESGVPIYTTNISPITYSTKKKSSEITKEKVEGVPGAFILHNVLTPDECQQYIDITEKMGYDEALVSVGIGAMVPMKDLRDNERVIWHTTEDVWRPIWDRVKSFLPPTSEVRNATWNIKDLNERFRFYKYKEGMMFQRHWDGCFPRSKNEMSHLTFIIYLSEDFEGGHTTFYVNGRAIQVKPVRGSALVFYHGPHRLSPEHEGSPCFNGKIKYVLRSDVMYERK